jgi:hypothetical protein
VRATGFEKTWAGTSRRESESSGVGTLDGEVQSCASATEFEGNEARMSCAPEGTAARVEALLVSSLEAWRRDADRVYLRVLLAELIALVADRNWE